jgi:hypothetical protein
MKYGSVALLAVLLFVGCASTTPKNVYLPMETPKTIPFFRHGLPIAAGYTDSSFILAYMQPIGSFSGQSNIICVWVLYPNASSKNVTEQEIKH